MSVSFSSIFLRRKKGKRLYRIINIAGLSISIMIAILVYSFVVKEIQTDRFHRNGKNIYRILTKSDRSAAFNATHCGLLAPLVSGEVSEIQASVRLWPMDFKIKTEDQEEWGPTEICTFADASLFEVFTFPLQSGTIASDSPRFWAVISEKAARRYFGDADPIGKHIYLQHEYWSSLPKDFQVIGIMKDIPAWSTIQGEIFLNYQSIENKTNWYSNFQTLTFVQLNPHVSATETARKITPMYAANSGEKESEVKLQPLYDIYYDQEQVQYLTNSNVPKGSLFLTRLLTGSTLLILFLASCNYVLIKIAQGHHRLSIFAIQRCFGADSKIVWKHFFAETGFYFMLSGLIATLLAWRIFPYFLDIISPQYRYPFPLSVQSILGFLLLLGLFIAFISSTLSVYFLKKLYSGGLRNNLSKRYSRFDIRKILVIISIAIFCLLVADTAIVHRQLNFILQKDLGYNPNEVISLGGSDARLKNLLLSNPDILSVACGSTLLPQTGTSFFKLTCWFEESGEMAEKVELLSGDADYLNTYQIALAEGENFAAESEPVSEGVVPIIVNQEFVKQANLQQPVGTIFRGGNPFDTSPTRFKIIGVVKDFYFRLLYERITPVGIVYSKGSQSQGYLNNDLTVLRYQAGKQAAVTQFLAKHHLSYTDYAYTGFYDKEKAFLRLINIAAVIAIVIGGLGIFAFAVFYTNSRKKDVALRKINGATEGEIQQLFNREFILLTFYACITGIPIAYYSLHTWLERFAYHVGLQWHFFVGVFLICLLFVLLIITWQIRRIVSVNPVDCLKEQT